MEDAKFEIVDDQPRDNFSRAGGVVPGREVTFRVTETGSEGVVWVPVNNYTSDYVISLIQPLANEILKLRRAASGN